MPDTLDIQDPPVISYAIASADIRYIEIETRHIFLRNDPKAGLVFQGEIFGSRPDCCIDLSEILLEYAMSCEGCREQNAALREGVLFGERLGNILVAKTFHETSKLPTIEKLSSTIRRCLNSMNAAYIEECKEDHLEYSMDCCPLSECARRTGLTRDVEIARLSFIALCKCLIISLAPNWVLVQPSERDINIPIHRVVISRL